MKSYRDLDVYKRGYSLAIEIHKFSLKLPKELQYDIADDIRRASRSIPSNVAEGLGRNKSDADKINFLNNSLGSVDEILFNLNFLLDLQLIDEKDHHRWLSEYTICGKQIYALINRIRKTSN